MLRQPALRSPQAQARPQRRASAGPAPMRPSMLIEQFGGTYAEQLGIDLSHRDPDEIYRWLIAAILFGARISETIAIKTYREFERASILSPQRMLDGGWDKLVEILDRGGYVRYDFKTATKLLAINQTLMQRYQGNLNALHDSAADEADLMRRLEELGKGVGDVTASIFLRELRGIWPKADPLPSARVIRASKALGWVPPDIDDPSRILQRLKAIWRKQRSRKSFSAFEAALVRCERTLRRKVKENEARI